MGNDRTTHFPVLFSDLLLRAILFGKVQITNAMVLADRNVVTVARGVCLNNCQNESSGTNEGMRPVVAKEISNMMVICLSISYWFNNPVQLCHQIIHKYTYTVSSHTSLSNLAIFTLDRKGNVCYQGMQSIFLRLLRTRLCSMVTGVLLTLGPSSPGGPGGPVEPCSPWRKDHRKGISTKSGNGK